MLYIVTIDDKSKRRDIIEFLKQENIKNKFVFLNKGKPFPVKCPESSTYKVWIVGTYDYDGGITFSYYCTRHEDAVLLCLVFGGIIN